MLLLVGIVLEARVRADVSTDEDKNVSELLRAIDEHAAEFLGGSIARALAYLALLGVLLYLCRVIQARRPELPRAALALAVIGPILFAIATILLDVSRLDVADQFVSGGEQTETRAEDLFEDRDAAAVGVGAGGTLALALALVLLSVNAIRAGVLSRFLGILGVITGVLLVIPIGSAGIIQLFWLGALVALFLDRWPGGRGPAWDKGEALPWPTAAERRTLAAPRSDAQRGEAGAAPGEDAARTDATAGEGADGDDGPMRRKRKRKRRR